MNTQRICVYLTAGKACYNLSASHLVFETLLNWQLNTVCHQLLVRV